MFVHDRAVALVVWAAVELGAEATPITAMPPTMAAVEMAIDRLVLLQSIPWFPSGGDGESRHFWWARRKGAGGSRSESGNCYACEPSLTLP